MFSVIILETKSGIKAIAQKYLLLDAPVKKITIRDYYRDMILANLEADGTPLPSMLYHAMEGLRFAQYEVFFTIKDFIWMAYCTTDLYKAMIARKEVRTQLPLFGSSVQALQGGQIGHAKDRNNTGSKHGAEKAAGIEFNTSDAPLFDELASLRPTTTRDEILLSYHRNNHDDLPQPAGRPTLRKGNSNVSNRSSMTRVSNGSFVTVSGVKAPLQSNDLRPAVVI